jgi:phage shock protein E
MTQRFYFYSGIAGAVYAGFAALRYYSLSGTQLISAARAKKMIKSGEIKHVVDVRSKFEWDFGHYPGAVHMPVNVISQRIV